MIDRDTFLEMLDDMALQGRIGQPAPYSGRAMFGKQCISLRGDSVSVWGLAVELTDRAPDYGIEIHDIPEPDTDSLGRGIVIYWPRLEWPEGREDPDDDEDPDDY